MKYLVTWKKQVEWIVEARSEKELECATKYVEDFDLDWEDLPVEIERVSKLYQNQKPDAVLLNGELLHPEEARQIALSRHLDDLEYKGVPIKCPSCGNKFQVSDWDYSRNRLQCRSCKTVLTSQEEDELLLDKPVDTKTLPLFE